LGFRPTVSVIIPVYNEDAVIFDKCLRSLRDQAKLDFEIIIANDGSKPYVREIFDKRKGPNWVFLDLPHKGKREAMYTGYKQAKGEILIFGDSDTLFERNCFYELVQPFTDPDIGATTGNVRILNNQTFLAKLSDFRYWIAFNLERAAQSRFGVMSCVSGPCGAYRRDLLDRVMDRWRDQTFMGKKCTYGDDRHLTNLVLLEGFRTKYVVSAHSRTLFPPTAGQWVRQQLRWSRSFYREYIVNIRSFHKHSAWLPYDLTYQALFPIFVGFNMIFVLLSSMLFDYRLLFLYFLLIVVFAFIRSLYGMMQTGKGGFLSLVVYGFIYVAILLPLKLYALLTLWNVGWGTSPRNGFKTDYSSKQSVLSFW
jgi:hyaluronan synthase/N-acetylglucosaminyltransferase